uniref:Glutaminyl-peptide cyclotransferase n=1 Tax=Parastrongyloides trichosuri TaxID=131310 RepID=A0A0N4ZYA5_PARTI
MSLLTIFIISITYLVDASDMWRLNQISHTMTRLSDSERFNLVGTWNEQEFKNLLQPIMVERIVGTPSHKRVGDYISNQAKQAGFEVEYDIFEDDTPYGRRQFKNIIATYNTSIPRRLVLACHYDSKIIPGKTMIAATDSAVPCAMILDIARTLGPLLESRVNKDLTLQLIFFDGEEAFVDWTQKDSIYGSRHLAKKWADEYFTDEACNAIGLIKTIDRIDNFVLLDLLGAPRTRLNAYSEHRNEKLFSFLIEIEKSLKNYDKLKSIENIFNPVALMGGIEDDHIPFLRRNVPILHLIPARFPHVWHTVDDDANILDYNSIHDILAVVKIFTAEYLGIQYF